MSQSMRSTSTKVKRSTKEREKRKSVAGNPDNSIATVIEKSSPTRVCMRTAEIQKFYESYYFRIVI